MYFYQPYYVIAIMYIFVCAFIVALAVGELSPSGSAWGPGRGSARPCLWHLWPRPRASSAGGGACGLGHGLAQSWW
jgi:hypothetical protein